MRSSNCLDFSIRRVEVKRLLKPSLGQRLLMSSRALLLFGIGARWPSQHGISWNEGQSKQRSHRVLTIDASPGTSSLHPSSREGHSSTLGRSRYRLFPFLCWTGYKFTASASSRAQRNSLPSDPYYSMHDNPNLRARATVALCRHSLVGDARHIQRNAAWALLITTAASNSQTSPMVRTSSCSGGPNVVGPERAGHDRRLQCPTEAMNLRVKSRTCW